jgi:1-acyl-sn-glycerol-3-phosphate acyltransferase
MAARGTEPEQTPPVKQVVPPVTLLHRVSWLFCNVLCTAMYGYRVLHGDRLPRSGAYLVAANHQSYLDPIIVGLASSTKWFFYLGRASLMTDGLWGRALRWVRCVPLDTTRGDTRALKYAVQLLRHEQAVVIFPEGQRSFDGRLGAFKPGAALLMRRARCPVVPVAVVGAFDAYPRQRKLPCLFGRRVITVIGEPIDSQDLLADGVESGMAELARRIEQLQAEGRDHLRRATQGMQPLPLR